MKCRRSADYRNGTSADYAYTPRGDLTCHDWNFTGTAPASCNSGAPELAWDFSYSGVGQLTSETVSDPLYAWQPQTLGSDAYVANGLNQYTSIKGVAPAYDVTVRGTAPCGECRRRSTPSGCAVSSV